MHGVCVAARNPSTTSFAFWSPKATARAAPTTSTERKTEPRPFSFQTDRRQERKQPLLYMDVNLGPGRTGRIGLHGDDDPQSRHQLLFVVFDCVYAQVPGGLSGATPCHVGAARLKHLLVGEKGRTVFVVID